MIIALCGAAGAGKTTVAQHLVATRGFTRLRFADPIKDMLRAMGLHDAELDGGLKETPTPLLCGHTPRHAMQTLGTEWGRDCVGAGLWVAVMAARLERLALELAPALPQVVVDDVRFPNELALLRDRGALVVRVDRPDAPGAGSHASETHAARLAVDLVLPNTGSIDDLRRRAEALPAAAHTLPDPHPATDEAPRCA